MAMPMGIFRLAMIQVGYTARQSLTVIELHFLGMYVPGFVSGKFIQQRGPPAAIYLSMLFSIAATVINLFSKNPDDGNIATWYFGLILLGFGWNFGFSASTVWLTGSYKSLPHLRSKVQAANECAMFFLAGIFIFSTGYIFEAGGSGLDGWKTINYVNFGMIGLMMALSTIGISGLLRAKEAETTN
jgi:MFS family permease